MHTFWNATFVVAHMKLSDHAVATSATPAAATFCPWVSGGLAQAAVETSRSTHKTQARMRRRRSNRHARAQLRDPSSGAIEDLTSIRKAQVLA